MSFTKTTEEDSYYNHLEKMSVSELLNNIKLGNITSIEQVESIVKRSNADLTTFIDVNLEGLKDDALRKVLNDKIKGHTSLGYRRARALMYGSIDNLNLDNDRSIVYCVYSRKTYNSGDKKRTESIDENLVEEDSNTRKRFLIGKDLALSPKGQTDGFLNCEHTWPQSLFKKKEPMRSDLHHLFPTDSIVNAIRAHYPFGNSIDSVWQKHGCKLGTDSDRRLVFEPRDDHKGNVARALFYFSVRYKSPLLDFEEKALREWNKIDPVDNNERRRNVEIEKFQHNRNPFIDQPELVDSISDF